jgi:anti-sigma regulatory factor (Ser/Thr protein kinase)
MTRLHFQPIKGKTLDIIDAILQTEEVASAGDMQRPVRLAVEELVVNIVDYAYPNSDKGYLGIDITRDEGGITLRFIDGGVPFNPLQTDMPDTTLPISQRKIGGLGILFVTKVMDSVTYEYAGGQNILTVKKRKMKK